MRPSNLVGLTDPYEAYCLDEATYMWGRYVKNELEIARSKIKDDKDGTKTQRAVDSKLQAILHPPVERPEGAEPAPVPKGQFRDPMQFLNKGKQG